MEDLLANSVPLEGDEGLLTAYEAGRLPPGTKIRIARPRTSWPGQRSTLTVDALEGVAGSQPEIVLVAHDRFGPFLWDINDHGKWRFEVVT